MRALKLPLVLALSIAVVSATGFTGCGSNSTSNGGTGGAGGGVAGSTGSGGASTGGNTGSGGRVDAGSDMRTAAGGAAGQDSGSSPMCVALLACCNSATPAQIQAGLKTQCLTAYNMAMPMGDSACGTVLNMIKANGLCN